jgi:hypothetical protein
MGVSEPQSLLRELAEAGLVVEYTREASALKGHAHVLTARLTGRLIGNGPHGSAQFLIEPGSASPPLALDVVLDQCLLWADGRSPIALSCERVGTSGLPHECDAIYHVAEWLPALLRAGLISLDRVAAGEEVTLLCRVRYALR